MCEVITKKNGCSWMLPGQVQELMMNGVNLVWTGVHFIEI